MRRNIVHLAVTSPFRIGAEVLSYCYGLSLGVRSGTADKFTTDFKAVTCKRCLAAIDAAKQLPADRHDHILKRVEAARQYLPRIRP